MTDRWLVRLQNRPLAVWAGREVLKPSARARYAVRAMIALSLHEGRGPVLLRDVAKHEGISAKYLEQLAGSLRRAGLVQAARGPNGGYELARPADRISAREILESVEGPTNLLNCLISPSSCQRSTICAARRLWAKVDTEVSAILSETTLADLREDQRMADAGDVPCYQI